MFKKYLSVSIILLSVVYFFVSKDAISITKTPASFVSVNNTSFGQNIPANITDVQGALNSINSKSTPASFVSVNNTSFGQNIPANITDVQGALNSINSININVINSGCRVHRSADQSISGGVTTQIQFNTIDYDENSEFNTSTYTFTAKTAGYYFVTIATRYTAFTLGDYLNTYIYKNGAEYSDGFTSYNNLNFAAGRVTDVIYLAVNDYITAYTRTENGGDLFAAIAQTYMTIRKMSN